MPIDKNGREYFIVGMDRQDLRDIYKYQLKGESAETNYKEILKKRQQKAQEEKELEKQINKEISSLLESKVNELLKVF